MTPPTYTACLRGHAANVLTFWRNIPEALGSVLDAGCDLADALWDALGSLVALLLTLLAPLFIVVSPLAALRVYLRKKRKHAMREAVRP